jgi:O-acetyl-ADP-ribose deacetylase (regulator of RNase III)
VASYLNGLVVVQVGDITQQKVDAIVNAANSSLLGGGGVDGAIHRAGGPAILEECRELRRTQYPEGLPTSDAVITSGGNLTARFVIHTVGPIYGRHDGREAELLAACYQNSLRLCSTKEIVSVAFPAISTGVYGYPHSEAAQITSQTIEENLRDHPTLEQVRLIFFKPADMQVFIAHQRFSS